MEATLSKPSYWAVLPASVRYDTRLPSTAKLLYAELSALTESYGYCWASNDYFARLYGVNERTVIRHLQSLESCGYIRIEDGGTPARKIYSGVNPLGGRPAEADAVSRPAAGRGGGARGDKNVSATDKNVSGGDKNVSGHFKNKIIKQDKETDPPTAPQGAGAGADFVPKTGASWKPERFEAFWRFFPLHTSKQAAIRAWDKLKPSDELLAVIGRALARQIAEEKARAERERRPYEWKLYASTYLNQARWTDEPRSAPQVAEAGPPPARKDLVQL